MRHLIAGIFSLLAAIIANAPAAGSAERANEESGTERIVSIGGDVTEILYALGFGDRIAAVDTTSKFPADALKDKPNVGYMRALSAEGVLSLAPTLILASEGAGPPDAVRALKSASISYIEVPSDDTPEGIATKITRLGSAVGREVEAAKLAEAVRAGFNKIAGLRKRITARKRVLFILNATTDRMIVGGKGTSAEAVLELAGADNAADGIGGYKPITPEGLVAMKPDAIVVMSGGRQGQGAKEVSEHRAVKLTPAGSVAQPLIREMDGGYLIGFGPRAPEAVHELLDWLYPKLGSKAEGGKS